MQTPKQSLVESVANTLASLILSFFLYYGLHSTGSLSALTHAEEALQMTVLFTKISVARNYVIRRVFNSLHITMPRLRRDFKGCIIGYGRTI